MTQPPIGPALLEWFRRHGRKHLPWQRDPSPYRVWVSEVMLQQTQVSTVVEYFERFTERFPELPDLAAAPLDSVLGLWSGLGYYARARHLHRAAQRVCAEFGGQLPSDLEQLQNLPGIGRSTAGAILALAHGQAQPILDGNVKRVLCRYHALPGWPGQTEVNRRLWQLAEWHTPSQDVAAYTQAIMDLGATLCTRSAPDCAACPLRPHCLAWREGQPGAYPEPKPRRDLPLRQTWMLMLQTPAGVLLRQRPAPGLWGGLWSFPEVEPGCEVVAWCRRQFGLHVRHWQVWPVLRHSFSHYRLDITPLRVLVDLPLRESGALENTPGSDILWYNPASPPECGLAAPVARLLRQLNNKPYDNQEITYDPHGTLR